MKQKDTESGISRRDFLKSAAATGAVGFAAASTLSLAGCVSPDEAEKKEVTGAQGGDNASYEVYSTEVLIVGGGSSAAWASQALLAAGKQIMVVDKGPFRHGGASGMSWDCRFVWPAPDVPNAAMFSPQLSDMQIFEKASEYAGEDFDPFLDIINHGETIPHRAADGTIIRKVFDSGGGGVHSTFFRRDIDNMKQVGINVMDEVMVTDLLINEGRCLGAIGLHLPSGTLRVIRANATILASNAGMLFRGRHSIGYYGVSSEDNTGDVQMALFRKGVGIAGSEFGGYDVFTCEPEDLAHTMGASICVDGPNAPFIYDANHERIFKEDTPVSNHVLCASIVKAIYEEGRGTEDNTVYVHYTDSDNPIYYITKNINLLKKFGADPHEGYVKIYPEMYEHGGQPIVDINLMTEFEGLFTPRGTNALSGWGGWISTHNKLFSNYVGKCVVDYLEGTDSFDVEEIDWSPVDAEYNRLYEVRTKTSESGIRPHELRAMIQDAGGLGFDYYRPTAQMEEAIKELVRIRKEELPKQVISDSSPTYNTEWKCAIENINILDVAEMSVRGALMREESRLCYRPEFPEQDDENWACNLVCKLVDGEMVFEKRLPSNSL